MNIVDFIDQAIAEDIPDRDHTSFSCFSEYQTCDATIVAHEAGTIAGVAVAREAFQRFDPDISFEALVEDGMLLDPESPIIEVRGVARAVLGAERTVLNFMQRMSGVATLTARFVRAVEGYSTKILDTRKTTPVFRYFEKEGVRIGGGVNHRMNLSDMIMIKDNHIAACGGISQAITRVNSYLKEYDLDLKVEIEGDNLEQVREIASVGKVNRIMLDNFSVDETREAVRIIDRRFETEASGGISIDNVREYAGAGVDFISVGALTHSYKSLDIGMDIERAE